MHVYMQHNVQMWSSCRISQIFKLNPCSYVSPILVGLHKNRHIADCRGRNDYVKIPMLYTIRIHFLYQKFNCVSATPFLFSELFQQQTNNCFLVPSKLKYCHFRLKCLNNDSLKCFSIHEISNSPCFQSKYLCTILK